jgi:hypothetical protein
MDDFPFSPGRLDVFGGRAMAFFTADIELDIFGFVSFINLLQLEPGIMAACIAHFKRFFYSRCLQATVFFVPVLEVVRNPPVAS